jgi:hypothetical protein
MRCVHNCLPPAALASCYYADCRNSTLPGTSTTDHYYTTAVDATAGKKLKTLIEKAEIVTHRVTCVGTSTGTSTSYISSQ